MLLLCWLKVALAASPEQVEARLAEVAPLRAERIETGAPAIDPAAVHKAAGGVIVSGLERLRRAKGHDRKSAVVVVDVSGPAETTEAIRLGADDLLLREAPDADLVAKVTRLLKRKVRG